MIIVDLNQVMISNLMMSLKKFSEVDENIIRHMILNSLRMNRKKFGDKYGEMVITCDDRDYWRKKSFPYYKANRKKNRDESEYDWNLIFQSLNKIRDELKEYFPYRVIQVEHGEADDIIGALCDRFGRELGGEHLLILSGDKDFSQLQKYSNVEQYDPTRKRWIRCSNPVTFLYEHVIRGDVGDGIPNILSDDSIFLTEGKRQSPIRQSKLNHWISCLSSDQPPSEIFDEKTLRNWYRNYELISLDKIPEEIVSEVHRQYDEQDEKTRSKMFNYFIKHKLKNLHEVIGDF